MQSELVKLPGYFSYGLGTRLASRLKSPHLRLNAVCLSLPTDFHHHSQRGGCVGIVCAHTHQAMQTNCGVNHDVALYQPYNTGGQSLACYTRSSSVGFPSPQTTHRTALSHPNCIRESNDTHSLTSIL